MGRVLRLAGVPAVTVALLALAGCAASSHVMIGKARAPVPVDQVKVYFDPPPKYEEIAILDASSQGSMIFTEQGKTDKAVERLKLEAAKLGANGVLFQGSGDKVGATIGTGGSTFGGSTALGIGLSGTITHKTAHGIAIVVP